MTTASRTTPLRLARIVLSLILATLATGWLAAAAHASPPRCKPPTVLHGGRCLHPDEIPAARPPGPPTTAPKPEPVPEPEPEPEPEPAPPTVQPEPAPTSPPPAPEPQPQVSQDPATGSSLDRSGTTTAGAVIGGLGVAGLVVGIITGVMVLDRQATVEDPAHCDATKACDQEGIDAAAEGETLATVSTITTIAGLVGMGVGVVLLVVGGDDEEPTTELGLSCPPGGGALLNIGGSF